MLDERRNTRELFARANIYDWEQGGLAMNGAGAAAVQTGDADLLTHPRAGRSCAYAALMRRHNQRLYRPARGILRDDAEAEEGCRKAMSVPSPISVVSKARRALPPGSRASS